MFNNVCDDARESSWASQGGANRLHRQWVIQQAGKHTSVQFVLFRARKRTFWCGTVSNSYNIYFPIVLIVVNLISHIKRNFPQYYHHCATCASVLKYSNQYLKESELTVTLFIVHITSGRPSVKNWSLKYLNSVHKFKFIYIIFFVMQKNKVLIVDTEAIWMRVIFLF